jgi:uncharacterized linocin/CFP29 family protein
MDPKISKALEGLKKELASIASENLRQVKELGDGSKDALEEMANLHKEIAALKKAEADRQAENSPAGKGGKQKKRRIGVGRQFVTSDGYKEWKSRKTIGSKNVPTQIDLDRSFFSKKTTEDYIGEENAGALVVAMERPDIIEKRVSEPIVRSLVTVMPTTETNSVSAGREVETRVPTVKLTADEGIGTSVFAVDSVQGFRDQMPFNTFRLDNDTTTETLLIADGGIDEDALTITTTAVSTIACVTGNLCTGTAYSSTDEGQIVPRTYTKFEDYTVPVVDLYTDVPITKNKLNDVASLQDFVERKGMALTAEMEDLNIFYSEPLKSTQMTGIFYDTDVTEMKWSEQATGTKIFDFILNAMVALMKLNWKPTALVLEPDVWKELVKSKASDGHYLYLPSLNGSVPDTILDLALKPANTLLPTHGVIADWAMAMTLYDRETSSIEIGTSGDDLKRRMRTLVMGERIAFGIDSPEGVIRMIFDSAPT